MSNLKANRNIVVVVVKHACYMPTNTQCVFVCSMLYLIKWQLLHTHNKIIVQICKHLTATTMVVTLFSIFLIMINTIILTLWSSLLKEFVSLINFVSPSQSHSLWQSQHSILFINYYLSLYECIYIYYIKCVCFFFFFCINSYYTIHCSVYWLLTKVS